MMLAVMALARKLAQKNPKVLRRTKMAINRTETGVHAALRAALDIDIMIEGEGSQLKRQFLQVVRDEGLGKALAWCEARVAGGS